MPKIKKYRVDDPSTYDRNNPDHHRDFMKRPDLWPSWPLLPLGKGSWPDRELAVYHAGGKVAYNVNMFRMPKEVEWVKISAEELVAAGWRVD